MIHVFGDSHAQVWKGTNAFGATIRPKMAGVAVHHLGPALAWNLMDEAGTAPGKWGEAVIEILQDPQTPATTGIILSFGEIDIRTRVVRSAIEQGIGLTEAARPIVDRLCDFAALLARKTDVPVILFEPIPSASDSNKSFIPAYPITGSELERNLATESFGQMARDRAAQLRTDEGVKVYSFGVFDDFTDHYETRSRAYRDSIHLGAAGFTVMRTRLHELCQDHGLDQVWAPFASIQPCTPLARPVDITGALKQSLSSRREGFRFLDAPKGWEVALWTDAEEAAHVDLVLANAMPLVRLDLWAGPGDGATPLSGLEVLGGMALNRLDRLTVFPDLDPDAEIGKDAPPVSVDLSGQPPIKILQLRRAGHGDICLARLRLVALSFDRRYPEV